MSQTCHTGSRLTNETFGRATLARRPATIDWHDVPRHVGKGLLYFFPHQRVDTHLAISMKRKRGRCIN